MANVRWLFGSDCTLVVDLCASRTRWESVLHRGNRKPFASEITGSPCQPSPPNQRNARFRSHSIAIHVHNTVSLFSRPILDWRGVLGRKGKRRNQGLSSSRQRAHEAFG